MGVGRGRDFNFPGFLVPSSSHCHPSPPQLPLPSKNNFSCQSNLQLSLSLLAAGPEMGNRRVLRGTPRRSLRGQEAARMGAGLSCTGTMQCFCPTTVSQAYRYKPPPEGGTEHSVPGKGGPSGQGGPTRKGQLCLADSQDPSSWPWVKHTQCPGCSPSTECRQMKFAKIRTSSQSGPQDSASPLHS